MQYDVCVTVRGLMMQNELKSLLFAALALLLFEQLPLLLFASAAISGQGEQSSRTLGRVQLLTTVEPEHYDILVKPNPDNLQFDGSAQIRIRVHEPTSEIVLNAADLQLKHVSLILSGDDTSEIRVDQEEQTATLRFVGRTLEVGTHVLAIKYQGKISEQSEGLFISRYGTPDDPKCMLATQFEPVSARRFVPCWDEPARKASFSISLRRDRKRRDCRLEHARGAGLGVGRWTPAYPISTKPQD